MIGNDSCSNYDCPHDGECRIISTGDAGPQPVCTCPICSAEILPVSKLIYCIVVSECTGTCLQNNATWQDNSQCLTYRNGNQNNPGLPTSRLQSEISDFLLYCRLFYFFYICLKPKLFCTSQHKTTSKHPRFPEFCLYCAKNFCDSQTKTGKAPVPSWLLLCLGSPMPCGNAYVKPFTKFPDFFKTQLWQPWNSLLII